MSKKSIPFIEVTNEPFRNCKLKSFQKKTKFQRLLKLDILSCSLVEKCAISCYLSILAQLHQLLLNITLRQATSNFALPAQSQSNISTRSALSYYKSSNWANLSATVKIVTLAKVPKPKVSLSSGSDGSGPGPLDLPITLASSL